jgi:hypothetical protein
LANTISQAVEPGGTSQGDLVLAQGDLRILTRPNQGNLSLVDVSQSDCLRLAERLPAHD